MQQNTAMVLIIIAALLSRGQNIPHCPETFSEIALAATCVRPHTQYVSGLVHTV